MSDMASTAGAPPAALEHITLEELLDAAVSSRQIDIHVSMPGVVDAYDAGTQTVTVIPQLNRSLPDGSGNFVSEALPVLKNIPVQFPRCKQFCITFPLVKGDSGKIVFCERSISAWRGMGQQGDPGDLGMHTLDGAVFEPGLYPDNAPAQHADGGTPATDKMYIGSDTDGPSRIEIKPSGGGNLGAGATKQIARQNDTVGNGTLVFAFNPGAGAASLSITYNPGNGGVPQVLAAGTGTLTIGEKITSGSNSWKAVD